MFPLTGRYCRLAIATAGALALSACGPDKRIKELSAGISRDSMLTIIGQGATAATDGGLPNVYRTEEYLADGHMLEVLFFSPGNEREGRDTVPASRLTPLVLEDGVLRTWSWSGYDSVAAANRIEQVIRKN